MTELEKARKKYEKMVGLSLAGVISIFTLEDFVNDHPYIFRNPIMCPEYLKTTTIKEPVIIPGKYCTEISPEE